MIRKRAFTKKIALAKSCGEFGEDNLFESGFGFGSYMPIDKNRKYISVGSDNVLRCSLEFETPTGEIKIGNRNYIGPGARLICSTTIEIEDDVTIAWGVCLYDSDSHSLDPAERHLDHQMYTSNVRNGRGVVQDKRWDVVNAKPIKICKDAWLGMNSTILKGVTIGEGAIVGACSVVRKDVEPWTVVTGNPAQVVKRLK